MAMETSKIHAVPSSHADGGTYERDSEGCATLGAIGDALAIFDAIDQGGLLEATPEDPADQARFQTAITLLDIMQRRLRQAVGNPDHLISGECRCNGKEHCAPRFA
jgi:hypothetical protein